MGLWEKLQTELNRAGRAAQGAIDEGKLRLEIFRVRQLADKAAQALGYAIYRARANNEELDAPTSERLMGTLREHEAEAKALQEQLARQTAATADAGANAGADAGADDSTAGNAASASAADDARTSTDSASTPPSSGV